MSFVMGLGVTCPIPVYATTAQEQLDQTNAQIDTIKAEQSQMQTDLDTYQADLETVTEEIAQIEEEIAQKQIGIDEIEQQIADLEEALAAQQQTVTDRMKYVYENDTSNMLEVLLTSQSFADFLNHAEYLFAMDQYDRTIIDSYNTTCEELAALRETLTSESTELADLQSQSQEKQSELEGQITDTNQDLVMSAEELAEKEAEAKLLEDQIDAANVTAMMAKAEEMLNYTDTQLVAVEVPVEVTEEIEVEVPIEEGDVIAADTSAETAIEDTTAQDAAQTSETAAVAQTPAASAPATTAPQTKTVKQTVTKTVYKTIYEEASETGAYPYPDYSGRVYNASAAERKLLAAIIYCEAGSEPYAGQLAVGSVVMNRVYSSSFPNTITAVISQSGQFAPVTSGRLAMILANESYTQSCLNAADAVLAGNLNVKYWFFFAAWYWKGNYAQQIGNQIFF